MTFRNRPLPGVRRRLSRALVGRGVAVNNTPPTITAPTEIEVASGDDFFFVDDDQIIIADANAGDTLTASWSIPGNGNFTLGQATGLSFSDGDGSEDASCTFTGSVANVAAAFAHANTKFTHSTADEAVITITVDDGVNEPVEHVITAIDPGDSEARTTAQAGNWSDTATWTGGVVPDANDTVTISHDVTVDENTTIGN
jgi:hypothetical protein